MSTWCLVPNLDSEPNVESLTVGRIARRRVQADRLPVPSTFAGPAESRFVPSAIGGLPAWFADHAERIWRCHPPAPLTSTFAGPAESRVMPSAIGGLLAWFADHAERIWPVPSPVVLRHGAWQLIRPTSRICGFSGSGGSPDAGCRRLACRCHPPHSVPPTRVSAIVMEYGAIAGMKGPLSLL